MTLEEAFARALSLDRMGPLLVLAALSYPILRTLEWFARRATQWFVNWGRSVEGLSSAAESLRAALSEITSETIHADRLVLAEQHTEKLAEQFERFRERLVAWGSLLENETLGRELRALRDEEVAARAYLHALRLLNEESSGVDTAAVNLVTYLRRAPSITLTREYYRNVFRSSTSKLEVVQLNAAKAATEFLSEVDRRWLRDKLQDEHENESIGAVVRQLS